MSTLNKRPSVSGSRKVDVNCGGRQRNGKEGAKNPRSLNHSHRKKTKELWIGTYNVRTLREDNRIDELEHELQNIKWDIIGLSETKRKGEAWIVLESGNVLLYKGNENESVNGVGFIVRKEQADRITSFSTISDRVAYITIQLNASKIMKIIQIYAPTSTYEDQEVEEFYDQVKTALNRTVKGKSIVHTMIIGDFNAKLGRKLDTDEDLECVGRYGSGKRNERGDTLIEFLNENKLYAMNTFFQKRSNRKWTWLSPNGKTRNEIDYILASHKHIIHDVSTLNQFDIGSDHRLVRAKVIINVKMERYTHFKKKLKITKVEDIKRERSEYKRIIENKLDEANNARINEMTITELNEEIVETITNAIREITPKINNSKTSQRNEIKQLLDQRRKLAAEDRKGTAEYTALCKLIRRRIKENKTKTQEEKINKVIEQNKSMKALKPKLGKKQIYALKNKDGEIIEDREEILKTVENFYRDLYNTKIPEPNNAEEFQRNAQRIINVGSEELPDIKLDEVNKALEHMKRNKSPGKDGVIVEFIKEGGEKLKKRVACLLNKCLLEGIIPEDWNDSTVILLHKKGDHHKLENYRPISLLPVLYKLLMKVITNRLSDKLDEYQSETQAGFRHGYGTRDHLLTMKLLTEKANEYNITLYLAFVDFEKAFDSVETWAILRGLRNCRIDQRYIDLLENISKKATATYKMHQPTDPVPLKRGVRQGDCLSPKLFTLALEDIFKKLEWQNIGINVNGKRLNHLRYADDIVLIAGNYNDLNYMVTSLNRQAASVGLKMNLTKTKTMMPTEQQETINVDNITIENVEEYIYLGQTVRLDRESQAKESKRRSKLAWAAFGKLSFILRSNNIQQHLKTKVFNQCILPIMTYGTENWSLTKAHLQKLAVTQRAMERAMLGISLSDKKKNTWIRQKTKVIDVLEKIASLKWSWAGHVARTDKARWTLTMLQWRPWSNKRSRGRPPNRWTNDIKMIAGLMWIKEAQNRPKWKSLKEAYVQLWTENG